MHGERRHLHTSTFCQGWEPIILRLILLQFQYHVQEDGGERYTLKLVYALTEHKREYSLYPLLECYHFLFGVFLGVSLGLKRPYLCVIGLKLGTGHIVSKWNIMINVIHVVVTSAVVDLLLSTLSRQSRICDRRHTIPSVIANIFIVSTSVSTIF